MPSLIVLSEQMRAAAAGLLGMTSSCHEEIGCRCCRLAGWQSGGRRVGVVAAQVNARLEFSAEAPSVIL